MAKLMQTGATEKAQRTVPTDEALRASGARIVEPEGITNE